MYRILLVEDDPGIAQAVCAGRMILRLRSLFCRTGEPFCSRAISLCS